MVWKRKIKIPISKIDDHVKHILREHNQEADHWANLGAEGQRKMIVDGSGNTDTRKAVKGFWNGSSKDNGKSGCGVVFKRVDRDKWVTMSRIAAEVTDVCVLTETLDLGFQQAPEYSAYQPVH